MTPLTIVLKMIMVSIIVSLVSCGQNNKLSDDFKKGLVTFEVRHSTRAEQLTDTVNSSEKGFGSLWTQFNEINARTREDTLIVDVNIELSKSHNYDGGFEFIQDTLFLYAKDLDKVPAKETIHSTLSYKILAKGQKYKEIVFRRLK